MARLVEEYESQQTVLDWLKIYIKLALDLKFNLESVQWYLSQKKKSDSDFEKYDWK